jgi:hypothetical protein
MSLLDGLRNLRRQRPIQTPDGRWDVAVWVNTHRLSECQKKDGERILDLARQEGIWVCESAEELAQVPVHTLFVTGHNFGENRPGLLKDLNDLGTRLRGRFIILNSCGGPFTRLRVRRLLKRTRATGVYAYHRKIPMGGVRRVFEGFVALGHRESGLYPAEAAGRATMNAIGS